MNVIVKDVIIIGKVLIFLYLVLNAKLVLGILRKKMPYKNKEKEKEYQRSYQKKWRKDNKDKWKQIRDKSESRVERIEYKNKWQKESPKAKLIRENFKENNPNTQREYSKRWVKNNPDKDKEKGRKFYYTLKGTVKRLKSHDKRRLGIDNKEITIDLIKLVNDRDKNCVYCKKSFNNLIEVEYDHINPFKPFSKFNMVRCCINCNRSKSNANVFEWCEFKGYVISEIVLDLFNKNNN